MKPEIEWGIIYIDSKVTHIGEIFIEIVILICSHISEKTPNIEYAMAMLSHAI